MKSNTEEIIAELEDILVEMTGELQNRYRFKTNRVFFEGMARCKEIIENRISRFKSPASNQKNFNTLELDKSTKTTTTHDL